MVRKTAGVALVAAGVAVAIYVGLWVCMVGGVVNVIDGVKATPTDGGLIAWGVVRATVIAGLTAGAGLFGIGGAGVYLFKGKKKSGKSRGKTAGS